MLRAATTDVILTADPNQNSAAINADIAAAQSGDTVQLPSGTYPISSSIQLKSGVNVVGAGQTQTSLQYAGTVSQPMFTDDGASNLTVSAFTLDGNSSVYAAEGIGAQNCSGLNIQGVTVENLTNNGAGAELGPQGIYFSGGVTSSVISGDTFKNIGVNSSYGAGIRLSAGSDNNQVLDNTVANTGRGGILLGQSTGNSIIGNTVSGSGQTAEGLGIEVQGCNDSLVQNNSVDHWISVDTSSGSAVRGNTISDTSGTYKFAGLELVDSQNVAFSHNTVSGGADLGISISSSGATSKNVYFGHNTVSAASTFGAQVQGSSAGVSQIYFKSNTFTATTDNSSGLYPSSDGIGFRFNGNAHFITLDGTQVTNNQNEGVQVTGGNIGDLTFKNTTISGNAGQAVDQDDGLPDVQWTNTTAINNGPTGMSNAVPANMGSAQPQPTVTIDAPTTLAPGEAGSFTADFSETDGSLGSVLWDFDDGLPATSAMATHTFFVPGTYDVAVVVWDSTGYAAETELSVTVTPEPTSAIALIGMAGVLLKRRARARAGCNCS